MPQMMPINWIMMYLFFIIIFLIFLMLNYYNFFYKFNNQMKYSSSNKINLTKNNLIWKW